jgi:hypothetical protein
VLSWFTPAQLFWLSAQVGTACFWRLARGRAAEPHPPPFHSCRQGQPGVGHRRLRACEGGSVTLAAAASSCEPRAWRDASHATVPLGQGRAPVVTRGRGWFRGSCAARGHAGSGRRAPRPASSGVVLWKLTPCPSKRQAARVAPHRVPPDHLSVRSAPTAALGVG